jgi:polar amino acid transport system substrate-binding protein
LPLRYTFRQGRSTGATPRPSWRAPALGATAALSAVALLAGCGSSSSDSTTTPKAGSSSSTSTSPSVDAALAAKVPAAVKADGKILVGSDTSYAPNEFLDQDGKTAIGFDVDLFKAVAAKLGLQATFETADFASIITGVKSGKYEMGVSSFTINPERKQQVNMVSYFSAGTQWATKKGNPAGIDIANACGKNIAVQKGTVQVVDITARSKKCTSSGKKGITIDQYQAQNAATAALVSGKDDAMLADSPVAAYAVKRTGGAVETLGAIYEAAPYGYVIKKDQPAFAQAIADALKALIADGTYQKVLPKWGVEQGALTTPAVNP